MQAASAFTIVQAAFAWLVDNYSTRADWAASARRVASLMIALDDLEQVEGRNGISHITVGRGREAALRLVNLSVTLEDGMPVVKKVNIAVRPGERLLIGGDSGAGKSTLLRAIAGLWPWGDGRIEVADRARVFFLPQRPYIPLGTLRRAATYPDGPDARSDATAVTEAFRSVGLGQYLHLLDAEAPWDQILSGGEKQRLAFARILLSNPDIIVMDEATSALDPRSQDLLMGLLVQHLGQPTIISVGHRPELEDYHDRKIVLERSDGSARIISDVPIARRSRTADPFPAGSRAKLLRQLPAQSRSNVVFLSLERQSSENSKANRIKVVKDPA
jgi:putative ATP-binding cassette transporter